MKNQKISQFDAVRAVDPAPAREMMRTPAPHICFGRLLHAVESATK
jgi:hypothetical protein